MLYDTLSRTTKPLETREPGHLRFYSCGPTVYSYAHIGNFRTFLTADLVVRTAEALGWRVSYVSNITDVGHLTQDDMADAGGEDKMVKALKSKEGEAFANIWDLARYYGDAFVADWRKLNLREPMVRPRATEHMREQILAIEELIRDGYAYETPTGVYFAIERFEEYGKLSGNRDRDNLMRAVRDVVQDENKRHPADFALWKKDDKHLMQWFSPWGWGFPGWHIECSVMARQYLGDTIDLHGGGEDLKFPHHECEIAQSEAATGEPFCNHWLHVTFLQVEGEKMSKSKGNFYTVRDLVDRDGYDPLALRYALMSVPYTKPLNFTLQTLRDASGNVERFRECERRIAAAGVDPLAERFAGVGAEIADAELARVADEALDALCDDLNTSVAIAKALEGTKIILREPKLDPAFARSAAAFLGRVNALLGIVRHEDEVAAAAKPSAGGVDVARVQALIDERAAAKKNRDFARADAIRNQLAEEGIELRDSPEGTTWVRRVPV